jgi:hypothetical protein
MNDFISIEWNFIVVTICYKIQQNNSSEMERTVLLYRRKHARLLMSDVRYGGECWTRRRPSSLAGRQKEKLKHIVMSKQTIAEKEHINK